MLINLLFPTTDSHIQPPFEITSPVSDMCRYPVDGTNRGGSGDVKHIDTTALVLFCLAFKAPTDIGHKMEVEEDESMSDIEDRMEVDQDGDVYISDVKDEGN